MTKPSNASSLLFDDMESGTGLLNDIRAEIIEACFELTDYNGRSSMTRPAMHLVLEEKDGVFHEDQWWTCGKSEDWNPSEDGKYILSVGSKKNLSKACNTSIFLRELMNCGFPKEKVQADITFLVGLEAHFKQIVVKGRDKTVKDGKEFDATVLCPTEIYRYPWDKKEEDKGSSSASGIDIEASLKNYILSKLESVGGKGISKADLPSLLMRDKPFNDADTTKMIKLIFDERWLKSHEEISYDNGVLSYVIPF